MFVSLLWLFLFLDKKKQKSRPNNARHRAAPAPTCLAVPDPHVTDTPCFNFWIWHFCQLLRNISYNKTGKRNF